jgi:hypothetical protein
MSDGGELPQTSVPAFGCLVYVVDVDGGVRARVANLAGIEVTAESERGALAKITAEFKRRVSEALGRGETIAWIDPPVDSEPGERRRFVPVHL